MNTSISNPERDEDGVGEPADIWLKDRENMAQLIASYQSGSGNLNKEAQEAWHQIVERHEKWILQFTRGQIYKKFPSLNINLAEDIRNEAFFKLHIELKSNRSVVALGAWFKEVIVNELYDRKRRNKHIWVHDEMEMKDLEFDQIDWEEASNDIDRKKYEECQDLALQKFFQSFPKYYPIIAMIVVDELTKSELYERLGRRDGATREFVNQCKKKFRPFLKPCLQYTKSYPNGF